MIFTFTGVSQKICNILIRASLRYVYQMIEGTRCAW